MSSKFLNSQLLMEVGNEMLSMVARKYKDIEKLSHPVLPQVQPGFLRQQLPKTPPLQPEDLRLILKDTEEKIFPGLTLWSHPNFFAYYPSNVSHASIIAEIFSQSFSSPGFQWITSPAQTELENIVCDWMVHSMQLPEKFYLKNSGGGTISNTVSDAVFISIHAAKRRKMKELGIDLQDPKILKFSAYYAENAHNCAAKGLLIKDIYNTRALPVKFQESTQNYQIDLDEFHKILKLDIENGLIPFWTSANWGTTGTCSYDQIEEIGDICREHKMWFNVDAAYAGSSWIIPKYREKVVGLDNADSIQINFAKLMQVGSGTLFYVGDKSQLIESMGQKLEFSLFKNIFTESQDVMDYKDWQVGLGRRFNSLKIWWMIRSLGVYGMQESIEQKIELAQYLAILIKENNKFRLFTKPELTLVTFVYVHQDIKKQNELNRLLQQKINSDTHLGYITGSEIKGIFFLRVAVANNSTTKESIKLFWDRVVELSDTLN